MVKKKKLPFSQRRMKRGSASHVSKAALLLQSLHFGDAALIPAHYAGGPVKWAEHNKRRHSQKAAGVETPTRLCTVSRERNIPASGALLLQFYTGCFREKRSRERIIVQGHSARLRKVLMRREILTVFYPQDDVSEVQPRLLLRQRLIRGHLHHWTTQQGSTGDV